MGRIIALFIVAFFIVSPFVNHFPFLAAGGFGHFNSLDASAYTVGGDGFDETVFDWVNFDSLRVQLGDIYGFSLSGFEPPVVCVVDSGFDGELWRDIALSLGEGAAESITYISVTETSGGYHVNTYIYLDGKIWRYKGLYWEAASIPNGEGDTNKHGSSIVYLLKSLSPSLRVLIVRVPNSGLVDPSDFNYVLERIAGGDFKYIHVKSHYTLFGKLITTISKITPDILSISIGVEENGIKQDLKEEITGNLESIYASGTRIFVASGNYYQLEDQRREAIVFPANLRFVYAVNSIYDYDHPSKKGEGELTNFSKYSNEIDLSEPGYNIETRIYDESSGKVENVIKAGTSYSAPLAALLYAYTKYAAKIIYKKFLEQKYGESFEENYKKKENGVAWPLVEKAFKYAAENVEGPNVPRPAIKSPLRFVDEGKRDMYNGYGTVDVYDAVNFVGFLARKLVSGGGYYLEGTRTVPFKINITISHLGDAAEKIYAEVFSGGISMMYKIYEYGGGKRLIKSGSVHMSVRETSKARLGEYYWVILEGSVTFDVKGGRTYVIELYWDYDNSNSFLFFNDVVKINVWGVEPYPPSPW